MLHLIDAALEAFLRATVPLSAQDVDVSFEAPDREWSAKLTRPTVSVFLWDIRRSNAQRSRPASRRSRSTGGSCDGCRCPASSCATSSPPGRPTTVTSGPCSPARCARSSPTRRSPRRTCPTSLQGMPPLRLLMDRANDEQPDFGTTLDGQLRPGIGLTVVAAGRHRACTRRPGRPVEVLELSTLRTDTGGRSTFAVRRVAGEVADPAAVGAEVVSPRGRGPGERGRTLRDRGGGRRRARDRHASHR